MFGRKKIDRPLYPLLPCGLRRGMRGQNLQVFSLMILGQVRIGSSGNESLQYDGFAAAKHPENGNKKPSGRPKKNSRPGRPFFSIASTALTQRQRAIENGICKRSQERLDKVARLSPGLLNKIAKGELSIKGALRLCEGMEVKPPRQDHPVENLKKAFSNLTETEKAQFKTWLDSFGPTTKESS